jgi:hypothetical protein
LPIPPKIKEKEKKKAFDVVDHDIMAKQLEIYGFNKKALAFFNFYMTNRTQQVQIGNAPVLQFEILTGRSFIYKINNNGSSIEP